VKRIKELAFTLDAKYVQSKNFFRDTGNWRGKRKKPFKIPWIDWRGNTLAIFKLWWYESWKKLGRPSGSLNKKACKQDGPRSPSIKKILVTANPYWDDPEGVYYNYWIIECAIDKYNRYFFVCPECKRVCQELCLAEMPGKLACYKCLGLELLCSYNPILYHYSRARVFSSYKRYQTKTSLLNNLLILMAYPFRILEQRKLAKIRDRKRGRRSYLKARKKARKDD